MPQRFSQAYPKTPSNSAPPTPNTTPHVTLTHAKALPISNSSASAASNRAAFQPLPPPTAIDRAALSASAASNRAAFQPLPPPTAIDRAALSLFSPEHSPLNTPPTTPATTPMIELHLNDQPSFTSLDNSGIPPSNLRQQLLRRTLPKTASAEEENKVTRTAAQTTKETGLEPWPLVQGPLVFRTLWWCVYALLFTFYVVAGEILPAIQEGVLRASRVFLHVPAPVKEEKDGEPSG